MYISSLSAIALAIGAAMGQTAGLDPITAPPQGPITIPAGSPYKIEWEKTECALISLQLLAGANPSTLEIQSPPIANMTENTGSFVWHVPRNLEVADTYGIILTVQSGNKTGDFQYSFPFHISGLSTRHHSGRKRPHY